MPDDIRRTFDRFCDAWASNDGAAVAAFFTDDGSLINPFGRRADGRSNIAAMYADFFAGMLRGTSTTIDVGGASRKLVSEDLAQLNKMMNEANVPHIVVPAAGRGAATAPSEEEQ